MNILKSLIIWLCFIPVAILNGGLIEGICIGKNYRRRMGVACQRNHIKRVYFPDNLAAASANDKDLYLQRWLVDWDRLGIVDNCF